MRAIAISEASQIAEARRGATDIAASLGADELSTGKTAIVATELATNLIKHGGGGEVLLSAYESGNAAGVQLIALDKGRGIANLQECLRDGYSSAGSAGHGLGAIRRQSQMMEVATWPGFGTAIIARVDVPNSRVRVGVPDRAPDHRVGVLDDRVLDDRDHMGVLKDRAGESAGAHPPPFGYVSVPKPGEDVCGDACAVVQTPTGRIAIAVDGLGHGPNAAIAATEALRLFHRHHRLPVPQILEYLHAGLRPTRGAAVSVASHDVARATVIYGGIGNIAGSLHLGTETRRMISLNGTAGHVARRIQTFDYPAPGGLLIMHSDGVATSWSLERYPGIQRMHPTLIAAVLYRDHARRRDDATVLAMKLEP